METIDVPFKLPVAFINDLVEGMAREMDEDVPPSDEEKIALFNDWVRHRAKETIRSRRYQRASALVDNSDIDSWE